MHNFDQNRLSILLEFLFEFSNQHIQIRKEGSIFLMDPTETRPKEAFTKRVQCFNQI